MEFKKMHYTFFFPCLQNFSLPPDIISYLWKFPLSADGLLKLYKSCKYFFFKQKVLIINKMNYCGKDLKMGKPSKVGALEVEDHQHALPPIWISRSLNIYHSNLCKFENIYRFSMKNLSVYHSSLNLADFEILIAEKAVISFYFYDSDIRYPDGKNVPINMILEKCPNVDKIFYKNDRERYCSDTLDRMNAIKFKKKICELSLDFKYLSDTFDPLLLCDFITQNVTSASKILLFIYDSDLNDRILTFKFCIESLLNSWKGEKPRIEFQ